MADSHSTLAPPPYTVAATNSIYMATTTARSQLPVSASTKNPKKTLPIEQYWYKKGIFGLHIRTSLRILQFVFAVVVAGLYGVDLAQATKTDSHGPTEWIYAETVVFLSIITCATHAAVTVRRVAWSAWDFVLFVLWMAQVGVFGTIYFPLDIQPEYEAATKSVSRMKAAVWIGLINMLLWFLTFVLGVAWCIRARKLTRRTDKHFNAQEVDLERMGHQENGCECIKQKSFGKPGYRHRGGNEETDGQGDAEFDEKADK